MTTDTLIARAQSYFPTLKIIEKTSSPLMRFLGGAMFFNKGFMTEFTTTIGDTVYIPSKDWLDRNLPVLIHEVVHMYDEKRIGMFYKMGYLFPQLLVPFLLPLFFLFQNT